MLVAALQASPADRARAEELARSGRSIEAIALFERIVEANPADLDAKLWVGRLALRLGRTSDAEAAFRWVLQVYPKDVDARIGLATVLTRKGSWQAALAILTATESDAGENGELFAALGRAYRRGGEDRRALEYYRRAMALAPDDSHLVVEFESVARTYGHWIALDGFFQTGVPGADVGSGTVSAAVRVAPAFHLGVTARAQQSPDYSDSVAGGFLVWRVARTTTATLQMIGGGKTALPRFDTFADVVRTIGLFEIGGGVRRLTFDGSDLTAVSSVFAWDREPWRLDARYTFSRSAFDATGETSGDNSVMFRGTWQGWRRIALQSTYAHGIESFENLTADQLGSLGTTTLAGGVRIDVSSLTRITTTWEHQWRSNQTTIDRFLLSVMQSIR
jgi:hypothetical protein